MTRPPSLADLTTDAARVSADLLAFASWLADTGHLPHPYALLDAVRHPARYGEHFDAFLADLSESEARERRTALRVA